MEVNAKESILKNIVEYVILILNLHPWKSCGIRFSKKSDLKDHLIEKHKLILIETR